eukprot:scaffold142600_cov35-Prasinocladus_malaysianus.AAC.1
MKHACHVLGMTPNFDQIPEFNRPEKPLEIYEFEACPFCKKVNTHHKPSRSLPPLLSLRLHSVAAAAHDDVNAGC